jgi:hypothetical protein
VKGQWVVSKWVLVNEEVRGVLRFCLDEKWWGL